MYSNGFQYQDTKLQHFPTAEGYVSIVEGSINYVYNYTDHLGNIRLSYGLDPEVQGQLKILSENHYYPYGLKHSNYNAIEYAYKENELGTYVVLDPTQRSDYRYKYNGMEFQDELGLNMTAMDFRQYDNSIGRFNGIDKLSELDYSGSPYSFGFNNPVYFSDPSGLTPLSDLPDYVQAMWFATPNGTNSTWINDGFGNFDNADGSSFINSNGFFFLNQEISGGGGGGFHVILPTMKIFVNSSGLLHQQQNHVYENSEFYEYWRNEQSQKKLNDLAGVLQNSGDLAMIIGTVLVFTGVGAPLGAALITYGGYTSLAGTGIELYNDAQKGELTYEKFFTKVALEIIPSKFAGEKAFNYLGEPLANELLNVGTIGADRVLDALRDTNTGPYR